MPETLSAVVAGHICLDMIPSLDHLGRQSTGEPVAFADLFRPGHLVSVGPALFSTGGPVSNTGLALFRLGIPTRLVAKVGADPFGQIVRGLVERYDPALAGGLVVDPGAVTSYSVIISPPGVDRIFLHCPGANDTFGPEDVDTRLVESAALFHFGYPPIMRRMYTGGGAELVEIFRRAKGTGVTTSLDMAFPDPSAESGRVDWVAILRAVLPYVDIFLPSFEEILFMLDRDRFEKLARSAAGGNLLSKITPELLSELAHEMVSMGAGIVAIKLGERGFYLCTAGIERIAEAGRAALKDAEEWANQELWAPCFQVDVVGTTGSGDATIAGFLSALLRGFSPRQAVTAAVAVGACNVEAADALSGIHPWEETMNRIQTGWERHALVIDHPGWRWDETSQIWVGSAEASIG